MTSRDLESVVLRDAETQRRAMLDIREWVLTRLREDHYETASIEDGAGTRIESDTLPEAFDEVEGLHLRITEVSCRLWQQQNPVNMMLNTGTELGISLGNGWSEDPRILKVSVDGINAGVVLETVEHISRMIETYPVYEEPERETPPEPAPWWKRLWVRWVAGSVVVLGIGTPLLVAYLTHAWGWNT